MLTLDNLESLDLDALERAVIEHNYHYWVRAQPIISDYLYDRLVERLRSADEASAVLEAVGSGGALDASYQSRITDVMEAYPPPAEYAFGERVTHDARMLSLDKCYDEETLRKWFAKFEGDVVVSPKVDGVAASLKYRGGELVLGATRGNGIQGEVITENARHIVDLPLTLAESSGAIEVRGEAYMPISVFEAKFQEEFANPRNTTAGALKQKDTGKTADYEIRFFAYDLIGERFETEADKFARLKALGFSCVDTEVVDEANLQVAYDALLTARTSFDYETDGVVYKTNVTAEHDRMGETSHHPRYAIAYKFQGESGVTTLDGVEWSVSRSGAINPVALVNPIFLSGVTITRISLHNLSIMANLGDEEGNLYLGSKVVVMRRGGVIPNMENVVEHGTELVVPPSACPECGADSYVESDVLYAHHTSRCRSFALSSLEHFVKVIRADGFGEKILGQLFDLGLVVSPPDFYKLTVDDLLPLDRMGEKLANKLVANIDGKRTLEGEALLRSLGILELGKHVSKVLAHEYHDMDKIRSLTVEELTAIPTIGESIARTVVEGLEERREVLDGLLEVVTVVWPQANPTSSTAAGPFVGKNVMFTGAMVSMKRDAAAKLVFEAGGKAASSVSSKLDYLVLGDKDVPRFEEGWRSSKLKKAEKLIKDGAEMQIISETAFLGLLEEAREAASAAQLTFSVTAPAGTDQVVVRGSHESLGGWEGAGLALERKGDGTFGGGFDAGGRSFEYKYTRGDWSTTEKTSDGGELANRNSDGESAIDDVVARWADG